MPTIVGVFDSEAGLTDVLNELYSHDIDSKAVSIMRDTGQRGDSQVEDTRDNPVAVPLIVPGGNTTVSNHPTPAVYPFKPDVVKSLNMDSEVLDFYRQVADNGGVVLFVEVDSNREALVTDSINKNDPVRLDHFE